MKKRLLSLLVVLSMLSAFVSMPTVSFAFTEGTQTASDVIEITKLEKTEVNVDGTTKYTVNFKLKETEKGSAYSNYFAFQVISQSFADEEIGDDIDETGDIFTGAGSGLYNSTVYPEVYGKIISELKLLDRVDGQTEYTFDFTMDKSAYNDPENGIDGSVFYIFFRSEGRTQQAYQAFNISNTGDVLADQAYITLDANGGDAITNAPASINAGTYTAEELTAAIGVTPTRTGYKFLGWAENSTDTEPAASVELSKNDESTAVTLYAVWEAKDTLTASDFEFTSPVTYDAEENPVVFTTLPSGVTSANITVKYDGSTEVPVNKGTYAITVSVAETENYAAITDLALGDYVISPANYTYDGDLIKTVAIGTDITQPQTITASVKDVKGNDVQGKFTATGTTTSISESTSEEVIWQFTPDTSDANYNTFTKTGTIVGLTRAEVVPNFTVPASDVEYGTAYTATANPTATGLTTDDYTITYLNTDDNSETSTAPTNVGTYKVKLTLNGDVFKFADNTTEALSNEFEIVAKELEITYPTITKEYDTTTDVKINGNDLSLSDLTLTGVIDGDDVSLTGTLSAAYNSADVKTANAVTISGITLTGADSDNYTISDSAFTTAGNITAKPLTATLKETANKSAKVYGKTLEDLEISDFNFAYNGTDITVSETELAGLSFESDALAETANAGTYNVAVDTQPTSGNYNVTTSSTITVNPLPVTITVTPVEPNVTYKGSAFANADLVTVTVKDGDNNDVTVPLKYTYEKGENTTETVTDAGSYSLTVGLDTEDANAANYSATEAAAAVTVEKADYAAPDAVESIIAIGTAVENFEIAGEVTAADGTTKVSGKFVITDTDKGNAEADKTYENLSWKFVPTAADENYNELTGTNGKLTASDKSDNAQTPDVTSVNAATVGGNGQLVIKKADNDNVTSDTAVVEYKSAADTDWTQTTLTDGAVTVEVPIGTYEVRYAETETTKAGASVQAEVSDAADNDNTPDAAGTAPTILDGNGTLVISKKADDTVTSDTATVQYREKGTDDWTDVVLADGTVTVDAAPGTYEVRYAATEGFAPGAIVEVVVPEATTYKISVETPAEDAHGTFTYTVGDGTPTNADTARVIPGTTVKITATPESSSYKVSKITLTDPDGKTTSVSTTNSEFTMPENDVAISVAFSKIITGGGSSGSSSYRVTFNSGDNGKITSGNTTAGVAYGKKLTSANIPTITANEGYEFLGWTQDGETIVDPTTVSITKATTFTAVYEESGIAATTAPTDTPIATETPDANPTAEPQADTGEHTAYIYGYEDGSFLPERGITRAETAAIFARALTDFAEGTKYANTFIDIDGTEWFADNVNYLAAIRVIDGYDDGTFRPDENITRQEFAAMIARLGDVLEAGEMPFTDVSEENWGIDYIYTVYANGWVEGYEDNTFRPENPITRAEAVKIVNGYLGRGTDEAGIADVDYTVFPDVSASHWAYYDIIEAANNHKFTEGTMPETWIE